MIANINDWILLSKLRDNIMASRIQNTWREYVKDKSFYFERLEARYNKLANHDFTDESYCIPKIRPIKTIQKKVKFSKTNITFRKMAKQESMIAFDGNYKPTTIYLKAILLWKCNLGPKNNFFDGICKNYVDCGSSIHWNTWTNNIIKILKKKGTIRLWSSLGEHKNFYTKDLEIFNTFKDQWNKHCKFDIDKGILNPYATDFVPSFFQPDDKYLKSCK
jgi:hypothetical protein